MRRRWGARRNLGRTPTRQQSARPPCQAAPPNGECAGRGVVTAGLRSEISDAGGGVDLATETTSPSPIGNGRRLVVMGGGLLLLRLVVGALLAGHGAQKRFGWVGGPGFDGTSRMFGSLGRRPARGFALLGGLIEFAGGCCLRPAWSRRSLLECWPRNVRRDLGGALGQGDLEHQRRK